MSDDQQMRTVGDSGKALEPEKRFKDANSFWGRYKILYDEDNLEGRAQKRAAVQGMIDGNPIYRDSALRADGEGWRANFNPREAEAIRNSNSAALWALSFSTENLIEVKPVGTVKMTPEDIAEQCGRIAQFYTQTMLAWDDFPHHMMMKTNDVVTFGAGYVAWYDEFDFRFSYVHHGAVKMPPRTKALIDNIGVIFIEDSIAARDLLRHAGTEESKTYGWNQEECQKTLIRRYGAKNAADGNDKDVKYDTSEWESAQQQVKNNDAGDAFGDMEDVPVVWGFVVSPDGLSVSQYCIENCLRQPGKGRGYLLERHSKRNSISECICPFFYNVGDGYIRSIKGQMQSLYPQLLTGARMLLATIDAAILSATVIVQNTGTTEQRVRKLGPITYLPSDSTPIQTSFTPSLDGLLLVRQMMAQLMNSNAGVYRRSVDDIRLKRGEARSAEEVRTEAENESRLETFQAMIYYMHLDRMHRECLRRLLSNTIEGSRGYEDAKRFRKMCNDAGVDAQLLKPENLRVRTARALGYGSVTQARVISEKLLNMAKEGLLDQIGQREAVRRLTALLVGWDHVDAFAPRQNRDEISTNETSIAALENVAIASGNPEVKVGVDQNHLLHADAVLSLLSRLIQGYAAGAGGQGQPIDPRMILPAFSVGIPHAGEHLGIASTNVANRPKAKEMLKTLKQIAAQAKKIQGDAEQIAAQEQKQAQEMQQQMADEAAQRDPVMRGEARKDAVVAADIQRKDVVAAAEVQRKTAKAEVDMKAKMMKTMVSVQPVPQVPAVQPIPMLEEEGMM